MTRLLIILVWMGFVVWLASCGDDPRPPALPDVPAQAAADRLGLLAEGESITAAGALAEADALEVRAATVTDPAEAARLKAKADDARLRSAIAAARAAAAAELRDQQAALAVSQRAELQALVEREATVAAELEASEALEQDRRRAGWAIGACVAAAVVLSLLRMSPWIALGLPGAVAAGLLWIAAWSSVPWLAWVLGLIVACVLLLGIVGLLIYAVREWRQWAADRENMPKHLADAASIKRQPAPVRWALDRLLGVARG